MTPQARLPEDPNMRRAQLYFLSAALDFVVPHMEEIQRLAFAVAIPLDAAAAQFPLDHLHWLRQRVSDAIFTLGEVKRST